MQQFQASIRSGRIGIEGDKVSGGKMVGGQLDVPQKHQIQ